MNCTSKLVHTKQINPFTNNR